MSKKRKTGFDILAHLSSSFVAILVTGYLLSFPLAGYGAMVAFKFRLFLVLCISYSILTIFTRVQLLLIGAKPFRPIRISMKGVQPDGLFLLLFLFFSLVSYIITSHDSSLLGPFRFEGIFTISLYVLSCLLLSRYFVPKVWMLSLFGASTSLFCVLCLIQLSGANPFGLYPAGYNYYDAGTYYAGEYLGTIGNVGLGASFLCIAIGILFMALIVSGMKKKWVLALPLSLAVFTLLKMNVDAGLVGFIGGGVLMLPVAISRKERLVPALIAYGTVLVASAASMVVVFHNGGAFLKVTPLFWAALIISLIFFAAAALCAKSVTISRFEDRLVHRVAVIATLLAILIPLIVLWFFYQGPEHGLIYEASEVLHGRLEDSFGTQRIYIWRAVLADVPDHLLFGTGPDTLGNWSIPPFERFNETLGRVVTSHIDAAHNEYLNILACQGLFALLAYLGVLLHLAIRWYRTPQNKLSAIAGAGVLFYCIQAFFGISMFITAPYFWVTLAVLLYAQGPKTNEEVPQ